MSKSTSFKPSFITIALISSIVITLTTYILRGLGILGFIPGIVILLLIALSVFMGIFYSISERRRF
ncbi:hypothetical protein WH8501_02690 [Crocosphaera watsonii WH 8501]|uniref:Uncharacterized protein n=4 Tax=Crocosphaera watsonii TaxID=263511 RepID=T2JT24_CROWT|nr:MULTISPECIES: hypothetical protein [Crocosphaera]EHJ12342.1 hypothetical protein CWATWH0003_2942 [Crocosphaera watsonii WH 0003]MCH2243752.1 hypothetical protein [Crocosphaera sp.]NQZ62400.1 hypothetical protein [Crocosphaera sp.]CCQ49725.1 FIG00559535: hypothetical protein [Crocosphaera watsonii WH 8502]CCQ58833.1 hypothetical protein CWATWH0005_3862 [Crocosphaera watsonii WH 0005]